MRFHVLALLLLLFFSCHHYKSMAAGYTAAGTISGKSDSLSKNQSRPNTYPSYRSLFTQVKAPCRVDLDTIDQGYYFYDSIKGLTDSLGNAFSDRCVPKEMAKTWIADSSNLETKSEQVDWTTTFDKFFALDNFGWFSLRPAMRIESADFDFLFVLKYAQTSATNGGFTTVYLLKYTKDGRLKKIKDIGRYGYYTTHDRKDEENYSYSKRTTDTYTMQLRYRTAGKLDIMEQETEETELSISGKKEVNKTTRKVLYKKHKTIGLQ